MTASTPSTGTGWAWNRHEISGAFGDLGVFLPLAVGLVVTCGLDAAAVFGFAGLLYIASGLYFRVVTPVQPMKTIGAYAIATAMTPLQISAAGMWMAALLLLIAATSATHSVQRLIPRSVIRGIQLATGVLLSIQGIRLVVGTSPMQIEMGAAEPYLLHTHLGPVPVGLLLGGVAVAIILLPFGRRFLPSGLAVVLFGILAGLLLALPRHFAGVTLDFNLPTPLPEGLPGLSDLAVALTALALPQLPVTLGNAVYSQADLAKSLFGKQAARVTPRALSMSMGIAAGVTALFSGMPMCHGSGGLAAHHRFGARTPVANLVIGGLFLIVGVVAGRGAVALFTLIPLSVLGAMLIFAGLELALTVQDVTKRRDLFVVVVMLGVAVAVNMAAAFGVGILLANLLRWPRLQV